jgi:hypothetical protein
VSTLSKEQFDKFIGEIASLQNLNTVEIHPGYLPRELAILLPTIFSLPKFSTLIVRGASEVLKTLDPSLAGKIRIQTTLQSLEDAGDLQINPRIFLLEASGWWTGWVSPLFFEENKTDSSSWYGHCIRP